MHNFDSELPRSSTQLDCKVMTELAQVATRMHLPDIYIWVWVVCPKKNVTFQKKIHGGRTGWSGLVQLDTSQSELDGASASQELGWANISRAEQSELSWLASQAELR